MKRKIVFLFVGFLVSFFTMQAQWTQVGADIDGEAANDLSGYSTSMSADGTVVAIGAVFNDGNGTNSGHVRVYRNLSGTWTQIGADIDGEASRDFSGFSVDLSSDGSVVAIGAYRNDGNGNNSGHVRIYQNLSGTWTQIGADIDGEAAGDYFGNSVSLSSDGNIVAIGAYRNAGNGNNAGQVRVYQNLSGTWTQIGADIDGEAAGDYFGKSVSINADGTIVAVGANGNDGNGNNSGSVRVYQNIGGTWTQVGADIDGEALEDQSGNSVSLSADGTIVAIGAFKNDGNGANSGHARVYQNVSGTWTQVGADIDGEAAGDNFGRTISLNASGTILAIGSVNNAGNGTNAGHVRVYQNVNGTWTQVGADIDGEAAADRSGASLCLNSDGSIVAIGAPANDGNGSSSGQVRVFKNTTLAIYNISKLSIDISPNPTDGIINLKLDNNIAVVSQVFVYDITGKTVYNKQFLTGDNQLRIDLSDFEKGIYILKVQSGDKVSATKIVKR